MPVPEFLWVESAGTALEEKPRVASTQFGDGYEQRGPDGLHPVRQVWTMKFADVEDAVANDIVAFFRARVTSMGLEAFDWAPLWAGGTKIRVTCREWSRTAGERWGESNISATFRQEFELT